MMGLSTASVQAGAPTVKNHRNAGPKIHPERGAFAGRRRGDAQRLNVQLGALGERLRRANRLKFDNNYRKVNPVKVPDAVIVRFDGLLC